MPTRRARMPMTLRSHTLDRPEAHGGPGVAADADEARSELGMAELNALASPALFNDRAEPCPHLAVVELPEPSLQGRTCQPFDVFRRSAYQLMCRSIRCWPRRRGDQRRVKL
jgi:hypothetical protein